MVVATDDASKPESPVLPEPGSLQRKVLDAAQGAGSKGVTDDELARLLQCERDEVTSPRSELVQQGLLWDSGYRCRNEKGVEEVCWGVTKQATASAQFDVPPLVREDVYVEQEGRYVTLHAGTARIRISPTPGDLVEITVTPPGSDPEQDGGAGIVLSFLAPGSEEVHEFACNPFTTPQDVLEMVEDMISPVFAVITGVRANL